MPVLQAAAFPTVSQAPARNNSKAIEVTVGLNNQQQKTKPYGKK